jgi:ribosomal protein S18 acetylase RimI-like enzyme
MQEIKIRDYFDADQSDAVLIHDQARPVELQGSCDARAFVPLMNDATDLAEFLSCRKLVACVGQKIVGFVGINKNEIGWLYMRTEDSGKGIGRKLLQQALKEIKEAEHLTANACVFVLNGNKPAIGLYQSEGFQIVETFKSRNNGYPCTIYRMQCF